MQRQVTTEEIVNAGLDSLRNALYVSMPGSVIAYHADTQTADVQPMVNDVRFDLDTGAVVFEPWSVIQAVPVCWPRFGGFVVVGALAQYDQVVLEAFDLDPGPWRAQGRSGKPANPADVRRLGGNYWRCVPTDLTGPIQSAPSSPGMVIGPDGKVAQIVFDGSTISLGAGSTDHVALASKVDACMTAIATHVHTGVTTGPGSSGTSPTLTTLPATGSALIKAQ